MFSIPSPLHPAIVHFPIVLLLIGTLAVGASVFFNRWRLSWTGAILLAMGAIGCFAAVQTGKSAQEIAGELPPAAESVLDAHEEWAERTEFAGAAAAAMAIAAATLGAVTKRRESRLNATTGWTRPTISGAVALSALALGARVFASVAALTACYFVYQTGHQGGELVYSHGVGIHITSASQPGESGIKPRSAHDND